MTQQRTVHKNNVHQPCSVVPVGRVLLSCPPLSKRTRDAKRHATPRAAAPVDAPERDAAASCTRVNAGWERAAAAGSAAGRRDAGGSGRSRAALKMSQHKKN